MQFTLLTVLRLFSPLPKLDPGGTLLLHLTQLFLFGFLHAFAFSFVSKTIARTLDLILGPILHPVYLSVRVVCRCVESFIDPMRENFMIIAIPIAHAAITVVYCVQPCRKIGADNNLMLKQLRANSSKRDEQVALLVQLQAKHTDQFNNLENNLDERDQHLAKTLTERYDFAMGRIVSENKRLRTVMAQQAQQCGEVCRAAVNEAVKTLLSKWEEDKQQHAEERQDRQRELEDMKTTFQELRVQEQTKESTLERVTKESSERQAELQVQVHAYKQQLADAVSAIDQLRIVQEKATAQIGSMVTQMNSQHTAQTDALRQQIGTLEAERTDLRVQLRKAGKAAAQNWKEKTEPSRRATMALAIVIQQLALHKPAVETRSAPPPSSTPIGQTPLPENLILHNIPDRCERVSADLTPDNDDSDDNGKHRNKPFLPTLHANANVGARSLAYKPEENQISITTSNDDICQRPKMTTARTPNLDYPVYRNSMNALMRTLPAIDFDKRFSAERNPTSPSSTSSSANASLLEVATPPLSPIHSPEHIHISGQRDLTFLNFAESSEDESATNNATEFRPRGHSTPRRRHKAQVSLSAASKEHTFGCIVARPAPPTPGRFLRSSPPAEDDDSHDDTTDSSFRPRGHSTSPRRRNIINNGSDRVVRPPSPACLPGDLSIIRFVCSLPDEELRPIDADCADSVEHSHDIDVRGVTSGFGPVGVKALRASHPEEQPQPVITELSKRHAENFASSSSPPVPAPSNPVLPRFSFPLVMGSPTVGGENTFDSPITQLVKRQHVRTASLQNSKPSVASIEQSGSRSSIGQVYTVRRGEARGLHASGEDQHPSPARHSAPPPRRSVLAAIADRSLSNVDDLGQTRCHSDQETSFRPRCGSTPKRTKASKVVKPRPASVRLPGDLSIIRWASSVPDQELLPLDVKRAEHADLPHDGPPIRGFVSVFGSGDYNASSSELEEEVSQRLSEHQLPKPPAVDPRDEGIPSPSSPLPSRKSQSAYESGVPSSALTKAPNNDERFTKSFKPIPSRYLPLPLGENFDLNNTFGLNNSSTFNSSHGVPSPIVLLAARRHARTQSLQHSGRQPASPLSKNPISFGQFHAEERVIDDEVSAVSPMGRRQRENQDLDDPVGKFGAGKRLLVDELSAGGPIGRRPRES